MDNKDIIIAIQHNNKDRDSTISNLYLYRQDKYRITGIYDMLIMRTVITLFEFLDRSKRNTKYADT